LLFTHFDALLDAGFITFTDSGHRLWLHAQMPMDRTVFFIPGA
jgi:hypothetical protein